MILHGIDMFSRHGFYFRIKLDIPYIMETAVNCKSKSQNWTELWTKFEVCVTSSASYLTLDSWNVEGLERVQKTKGSWNWLQLMHCAYLGIS